MTSSFPTVPAGPKPGPHSYPPPGYYAVPPDNTPLTLILVGAIIASVFLGLSAIYMFVFGFFIIPMMTSTPEEPVPDSLVGIMLAFAAVSLTFQAVGVFLSFQGRSMVKRGQIRRGYTRAVVGGCFLVPNIIAGTLILVGAIIGRGRTQPGSP